MHLQLSELLKDIYPVTTNQDCDIQSLALDSRQVKVNTLFIACRGEQYDGRSYINEAIINGAIAIVAEAEGADAVLPLKSKILLLRIPKLQQALSTIAARFYQDPTASLNVIGITGTNGKTSCSHFIARALQKHGKKCGIIGTLGMGFPDQLIPSNLTTPDALTLQSEFAELKKQGAQAVAMEVSSHSLVQQRVNGIHFDIAVFTNLTRDHLDYHGTMENYAAAKQQLFMMPGLRYAVINLDDYQGLQYLQQLPKTVKAYGYSIAGAVADIPLVRAINVVPTERGFRGQIESPWGEGELHSQLLGRFNLSNLLAVLTTLLILEVPLKAALGYLAEMTVVPGRLQVLHEANQPVVVVDYSHTPDALEKALLALREHCAGKLWCVFGCGGERDRGKRPLMAQVAEKLSDHVIVTDDNPRRESSQTIIQEIVAGFSNAKNAKNIPDRRTAITHAIQSAAKQDVILIAGKGHETYQIIGTEKLPFSDVDVALEELKQAK
jgi:UDP-N-acetylmuramoyl-L-alanyl-D-glutamate--2,6-diaminopimelate ligase